MDSGVCCTIFVSTNLSILLYIYDTHRAEHGSGANSRITGGKLSIRRRRKGNRSE